MKTKSPTVQEVFWFGMPEFVQPKQKPFLELIIRFRNEADLKDFSDLIQQKVTPKTKSLWHPELIRGLHGGKRYVE